MSDIDFGDLTPSEMLKKVNAAIASVMVGGQSYKIGSRSLTRADLNALRALKNELIAEESAENEQSLLGGAYVSYFDGR